MFLLVCSEFRIAIDDAFGDFCQLLISLSLFLERIGKKGNDLVLAEKLGEGSGGSIAGNLVVLHLLGDADNEGVAHLVARVQLQSALALLNEAFHGLALFTPT